MVEGGVPGPELEGTGGLTPGKHSVKRHRGTGLQANGHKLLERCGRSQKAT